MSRPIGPLLMMMTAISLLARPAVAAPVAELQVAGTEVRFLPLVEHTGAVLTVTTPQGAVLRYETATGVPSFGLFDANGQPRPDGVYVWELRLRPAQAGAGPRAAQRRAPVQSGSFAIAEGTFVGGGEEEEPSTPALAASGARSAAAATELIAEDLIVQGSACVGVLCEESEIFNDDTTLRLHELSLRIDFVDDSTGGSGGYPANDWRLLANDSTQGGQSRFAIEDVSGDTIPFSVRAGAPSDSLVISGLSGFVGLGTATPGSNLHLVDTAPSLRLEGTIGNPHVWDVGTVSNFFYVRDITAGPFFYPFKIHAGAPSESLVVSDDGDVGLGTLRPDTKLHLEGSDGSNKLLVEETSSTVTAREMAELRNNGGAVIVFEDTTVPERWSNGTNGNTFVINNQALAGVEFTFGSTGNLTATGTITPGSSRTLKEAFAAIEPRDVLAKVLTLPITTWSYKADPAVRHLGPLAEDFFAAFALGPDARGISVTDSAGVALAAIQALHQELAARDARIEALQQRLASLEAALLSPTGD